MATAAEQTFRDFLRRRADIEPAARAARQEWINALSELRQQLKRWILELDPDGYLVVREREFPRLDPKLGGRYDTPGLEVHLGANAALVEPSGRYMNSVGRPLLGQMWTTGDDFGPPHGVVLLRSEATGAAYALARFQPAGTNHVWVLNARPNGFRSGPAVPFDREQFGLVLQELLS